MNDYRSCLWYALDKWNSEGGYVILRKSIHWCIPHVLHMDNTGRITHYVPHKKLSAPIKAVLGFDGKLLEGDTDPGAPMPRLCMLAGTLILLVWGGIWVIKKLFQKQVDSSGRPV